jgi:hypothetical protein
MLWIIAFVVVVALFLIWSDHVKQGAPWQPCEADKVFEMLWLKRLDQTHLFEPSTSEERGITKAILSRGGGFSEVVCPLKEVPAATAAALKGKHHEWIVVVFARNGLATSMWSNKGLDKSRVHLATTLTQLVRHAQKTGADTVVVLHNHPNSVGARVSFLGASHQDRISADHSGPLFVREGMRYFEGVCERGDWLIYDGFVPGVGLDERANIQSEVLESMNSPAIRRALRSKINGLEPWSSRSNAVQQKRAMHRILEGTTTKQGN